tara:strand:- start:218 stop:589 length:372 start_codon:yes stop_codon:yes gene_type:complete
MNLGKKYKQLFEGRKSDYFDALNEDPYRPGDYKLGKTFSAQDEDPSQPEGMDMAYYSDQINQLLTAIDDFHQELGTDIEQKSERSGNYQYDTMEKQASRYINGAQKQLEGLQKYIERQKGKGL